MHCHHCVRRYERESVAVEAVCVVSLNYGECDTATRNCVTEWSLRVTATQLLKKRRHGRPSENKSKLASLKTVLNFDHEMYLPVKGKRRRCAYCSTKEANFRSSIKCFTCKLPFCLKEEKNCFFDYHKVFM